jgi:glycosyltransferase involved in cell wall biosynthesis
LDSLIPAVDAALGDVDGAVARPAIRRTAAALGARARPARIGLDACCFIGSRTGVANYVEALLIPLCAQHPDVTFVLYANGDGDFPVAPNIEHRISRPMRRGPVWHNTQLARSLQDDGIDVFWGTNGLIPLHGLWGIGSVVTIHDLVHRFAPQTQRTAVRWKQRVFQPLCARAADRLVAVSSATADDVAAHYGRPPDAVIHPPARPEFGPVDDTAAADATLGRYGLSTPYLLAVGTLEPRKNLLALVEAHVACTAEDAALPTLVLVGGPGWHDARLRATLDESVRGGRVRWLGYVPTEALVHLYARCHAYLMPSLYEGFGIPLLEAQLCRAPVVHGEHASMSEAAGGAGVRIGTTPEGLRRALRQLAEGRMPLVTRLPSDIRNDADESARRLWGVIGAAWHARSLRLAAQLA